MPTRSDTLEKLIGRRAVTCLGFVFLTVVLLFAVAFAYTYFKGTPPDNAPPNPAPKQP